MEYKRDDDDFNKNKKPYSLKRCVWHGTEAWLERDVESDICEDCSGADETCRDYWALKDYLVYEKDTDYEIDEDDKLDNREVIITAEDIMKYAKKKREEGPKQE